MRILLADPLAGRDTDVLIIFTDPTLLSGDGLQLADEECLDLPGLNAQAHRSTHVVVHPLDRTGNSLTLDETGLLAGILQHELDHLNGEFHTDRLTSLHRELLIQKTRTLRRTGK